MKNKFWVFLIIVTISSVTLIAKNNTKDTLKVTGWYPKAVAGINVSQLALSNWTQGGDNSLTWAVTFNGGIKYFSPKWEVKNHLKAAFGRSRLGGQDFRTNENELFLENILSRHYGWAVDPFISNSIRTSITTGFNYKKDPPEKIADFFDPGYVTQSLGFTYDKLAEFKTRLGLAVQEVFTNKYRQYSNDSTTSKQEAFKLDTGVESVTSGHFEIAENMKLKSSLRLFTRFESLNVWDVRWDNTLIAKVNSFLHVNLSYLVVYQKDQSPDTQMKEALQLGFVYNIL